MGLYWLMHVNIKWRGVAVEDGRNVGENKDGW